MGAQISTESLLKGTVGDEGANSTGYRAGEYIGSAGSLSETKNDGTEFTGVKIGGGGGSDSNPWPLVIFVFALIIICGVIPLLCVDTVTLILCPEKFFSACCKYVCRRRHREDDHDDDVEAVTVKSTKSAQPHPCTENAGSMRFSPRDGDLPVPSPSAPLAPVTTQVGLDDTGTVNSGEKNNVVINCESIKTIIFESSKMSAPTFQPTVQYPPAYQFESQ